MPHKHHEIVSAFFPDITAGPAAELSIDVVDAWTITGTVPTVPTTISWCDGGSGQSPA